MATAVAVSMRQHHHRRRRRRRYMIKWPNGLRHRSYRKRVPIIMLVAITVVDGFILVSKRVKRLDCTVYTLVPHSYQRWNGRQWIWSIRSYINTIHNYCIVPDCYYGTCWNIPCSRRYIPPI